MTLNVSDRALETMSGVLDARETNEGEALRLAASGQGEFGLVLDEARDGDQLITHEDRTVLVVDSEVAARLDGATLDVADTPGGARLTIRPPE